MEYSCSSVAHNGLIVDDLNYVTPSYSDWTTMKEYKENDSYVLIQMEHSLYENVILKRKLIWIKPNVIVLLDECKSENKLEHKFSQNFLLDDFELKNDGNNQVLVKIDSNHYAKVTQIKADDNILDFQRYTGTNNVKDQKNNRGSLITNWKNLKKANNIVFSKKSHYARFITIIENNKGDETNEVHIDDVKYYENYSEIILNGKSLLIDFTE